MFTRKARAALRKSRQGKVSDYVSLLLEGEKAALQGKTEADCPYKTDTEDAHLWTEGFRDALA
jgi:ribosome modulation factor